MGCRLQLFKWMTYLGFQIIEHGVFPLKEKIEDMLNPTFNGGKRFYKLDLSYTYQQLR